MNKDLKRWKRKNMYIRVSTGTESFHVLQDALELRLKDYFNE